MWQQLQSIAVSMQVLCIWMLLYVYASEGWGPSTSLLYFSAKINPHIYIREQRCWSVFVDTRHITLTLQAAQYPEAPWTSFPQPGELMFKQPGSVHVASDPLCWKHRDYHGSLKDVMILHAIYCTKSCSESLMEKHLYSVCWWRLSDQQDTPVINTGIYMYIYMCYMMYILYNYMIHIHIYIYMCIYIYIYICVYIYIHIYICMYMYIYACPH